MTTQDPSNVVSFPQPPAPEVPFHSRSNGLRLQHYLGMIPPRANARSERMFHEYRILDNLRSRVLIVEWYRDDYTVEQVPEGILAFSRGFECGFISSDGEIFNGSTGARYRASIIDLHGDQKVTTLEMGDGHYAAPIKREHWAALVTYIKDERLRNGMIHSSINNPPPPNPTPLDFLIAAHQVHVDTQRFGTAFGEVSAIVLF